MTIQPNDIEQCTGTQNNSQISLQSIRYLAKDPNATTVKSSLVLVTRVYIVKVELD